ncbi:hypothetical protein IAR55_004481 [Kwoniella newhampshirensis]|uniref:Uncharacterized protein n=1 Tax=Kwoniella newhampshirensis TaxID=1651941 RepID=A0AAW0YXD6_9TREE
MSTRRGDENFLVHRRSASLHPASIKKAGAKENLINSTRSGLKATKGVDGAGDRKALGSDPSASRIDNEKTTRTITKQATNTISRRPALSTKPVAGPQQTNIPTLPLRSTLGSFKGSASSTTSGGIPSSLKQKPKTPASARTRLIGTPASRGGVKKTLNVYTPAPKSTLRSALVGKDRDRVDDVEYMPPSIKETSYQPPTSMRDSSKENDDLFAPTLTQPPALDLDLDFDLNMGGDDHSRRTDKMKRSPGRYISTKSDSLVLDDSPVEDFLFDL